MKIKEVETLTGLTRANIRFYESKGLFVPERQENNYREYSPKDVEALKKILLLRKLGISIEDLQKLTTGNQNLQETLKSTKEQITSQIQDLQGALELCEVLQENQEQMDTLTAQPYLELMEKKEKEGKSFQTIVNDVLKDYQKYIMEQSFHMRPIKGKRWLGALVILVLAGIWRVILDWILNPETTWESHLRYFWYWFEIFVVVSAVFLLVRFLLEVNKKLANVLLCIIMGCCVLFVLMLIVGVISSIVMRLG